MKNSYKLFRLSMRHNSSIKKYIGIAVLLEILSVFMLYLLNSTYGVLYQGIKDMDSVVIWQSIGTFAGIAMVLVVVNGYLGYFLSRLAFELRTGLTNFALETKFAYPPSQYAQRVQEDFKYYGELAVEFWAAILKACLKIPVFVGVIVTLTQWWVGASIIGAVVIGTIATRILGRPLVQLQAQQETNEAEFRSNLRANEEVGTGFFNQVYYNIIMRQFRTINHATKRLNFLQSGLGQAFTLLPFILLMPLYLAKSLPMGEFFQSVRALGTIIDSLTILIDNRQLIVHFESVLTRLEWVNER